MRVGSISLVAAAIAIAACGSPPAAQAPAPASSLASTEPPPAPPPAPPVPAPPVAPPASTPAADACRVLASEIDAKRTQLATCQPVCDSGNYAVCELVADLAAELHVGREPDSPAVFPISQWSQACKGAAVQSACTKRDDAIAKLKSACKPGAVDPCLDYGDAIGWGVWNADKKKEQEDLIERVCLSGRGSAKGCAKFAGLAFNMDAPLRKRAVRALERGCALGDGQQCCTLATGYDAPNAQIRDDPREAKRWAQAAAKAGYTSCEADRATRRHAMQPPIIY